MTEVVHPSASRAAVLASLLAMPFFSANYTLLQEEELHSKVLQPSANSYYYDDVSVKLRTQFDGDQDADCVELLDLGISAVLIENLSRDLGLDFFALSQFIENSVLDLKSHGYKYLKIDTRFQIDKEIGDTLGTISFYVAGDELKKLDAELAIADNLIDNPANLFFEIVLV